MRGRQPPLRARVHFRLERFTYGTNHIADGPDKISELLVRKAPHGSVRQFEFVDLELRNALGLRDAVTIKPELPRKERDAARQNGPFVEALRSDNYRYYIAALIESLR